MLSLFKSDVDEEVSTMLSADFSIDVTKTNNVPHFADSAITFPDLDQKSQGTKIIETAVLYVDMRRSTELSLKHRQYTVAKLYSSFVRAMTRCAKRYGGEVRGIIGDRVMMLFDAPNCFVNAKKTAVLINSVCQYVIDKKFVHNQVSFGIGIDYGRMLATKTGIRRHGSQQQNYRALVWLGRPANIASKLTDNANKPEIAHDLPMLNVAYDYLNNGSLPLIKKEHPHLFVQNFRYDPTTRLMLHTDPAFRSFTVGTERWVEKEKTPPILMTKRFYEGYRSAQPDDESITNEWFKKVNITVPEYKDDIYGGDVIFSVFNA